MASSWGPARPDRRAVAERPGSGPRTAPTGTASQRIGLAKRAAPGRAAGAAGAGRDARAWRTHRRDLPRRGLDRAVPRRAAHRWAADAGTRRGQASAWRAGAGLAACADQGA